MSAAVDAIRAAGGQRMTGPRALSGDWRRALALTWTLGYLEFRLQFFGSVLGYLWQLARPLLMFGIYFVIFTQFVDLSADIPYYAPMLLLSIMLYQVFVEATSGAVTAVLNRENLVRKIHFPRIVIPLSVVVTAGLTMLVNTVAVGVFVAIQGVPVRASWLLAIPLIAFLFVFVTGLAMLLSALFVRYRDVQPIWSVVTQAAFYATPILYPIERVEINWAKELLLCNPLAAVVQQLRHSVFDPAAPSAAEAIGGSGRLLIPAAVALGTFALGLWTFNRMAPDAAEEL
jgi:ABC-2 type transport system permease protein